MRKLKIYEAGKMGGLTFDEMYSWRTELKGKLDIAARMNDCKITTINPVDYYNFEQVMHQSETEVEDFDLAHATTSDIVVVNLEGLKTSIGSIIELHDCNYHKRIPVIAFGDKKLYDDLHPWVKRDITRIEPDINGVVKYIKDFYMV